MIPIVEYDPAHTKNAGANAPDGSIEMTIQCVASDCTAPRYTIDVLEHGTGAVLASGEIRCTGRAEPHRLSLNAKRALAAVRVTLRFTCGTREERDDDPSSIWIRKTT